MRKRMKSLLLVLGMLITMIPTTFMATEMNSEEGKFTVAVESEHGVVVDGTHIIIKLENLEDVNGDGYYEILDEVVIAESTTGEVECSVNYDEEKLVYIHDGKEYGYIYVAVGLPDGFESLDGRTRIGEYIEPEYYTSEVYVRVEDLSDGDSRGEETEDIIVENDDYTVTRYYSYNGVLQTTYISYYGEWKDETALEALSYCHSAGDVIFNIVGDRFPTMSTEVMVKLEGYDAGLSCVNTELKAAVALEEIEDKNKFSFDMKKNNNTNLVNKIKDAGVDFGFVQYEITGVGQLILAIMDCDIAEGLFTSVEGNSAQEKYLYYYNTDTDRLILCSDMSAVYINDEIKLNGETIERRIYFKMNQYGYGTYIVSDKALPESLLNVNLGLNSTQNPEETPDSEAVVKTEGAWKKDNTGWWYQRADGSYPANAWEQIDGKWYAFDARGYMREGWFLDGSTWYYLNYGSGAMATGWVNDGGTWYYMNSSGAMQTGWIKDGNTWYYLKSSGAMATGWIKDGSTWYYLKSSGAMATGWVNDGGTWYYMNSSGAMQTGWIKDGSTWYYLKSSGAMATGWVNDGGTWYYMNGSGAMQTGWVYTGGKWYYMYESGAMASNTWIGGYRLDASGAWVA